MNFDIAKGCVFLKIKIENGFVMPARDTVFCYHGWPSVCRGPKGDLIAVCSGLRLAHVCPFGKTILSRSYDEGKTWTRPQIIIDTPLDDRDSGVSVFNGDKLIVTSFNHYIHDQKNYPCDTEFAETMKNAYFSNNRITEELEKKYYGSTYVVSDDNGITWSEVKHAPVTAPHGPCALKNGGLIYMGNPRSYNEQKSYPAENTLEVWFSPDAENWTQYAVIKNPPKGVVYCEPQIAELPNGNLLGTIRVQGEIKNGHYSERIFSVYQTESDDGGKTWTTPHKIVEFGSPPHVLVHSSGKLVCVYGYRREPFGERAKISTDNGKTWGEELILCDNAPNTDLGYPASVELTDGRILTLYYQKRDEKTPPEIMYTIWKIPN